MRALLALPLLLAACAPDVRLDGRIPAAERVAPPPALAPLGPLLARADALPVEPAFAPALEARAEALNAALDAAARTGPTPSGGDEAARLAALLARAEALRQAGLTEAERARLLGPAG